MENPWKSLPLEAPYLLPEDRVAVETFNRSCREARKIHAEVLPEPFLGRRDAPIVLLNLNPGFSERDVETHRLPGFAQASRGNLLHAEAEYPFHLLDPRWQSAPGNKWWTQRLRRIIEPFGLHRVASSVLCVEFFPYHSTKFGHDKLRVPSQAYSFDLVRQAIDRDAHVLLLRGKRIWFEAVPELANYHLLQCTNSVQSAFVSPGNCPTFFERIVRLLGDAEERAA